MSQAYAEPDGLLLQPIARQIDGAEDKRDKLAIGVALQRCDEVEANLSSPSSIPLLHYFRANAHAALLKLSGTATGWAWREPNLEAQIFNLRRAVAHNHFGQLNEFRRLQCLTNLANGLNYLGRSVEALEIYDRAIDINAKFGMALGNRGLANSYFAQSLFNKGDATIGMILAYDDLRASEAKGILWDSSSYKDAKKTFGERADWIEGKVDIDAMRAAGRLEDGSAGRSTLEKAYRNWALQNRLFINPINVFGPWAAGAGDVLTLPSHRTKVNEPPKYIAWFNAMVQEFVAARALLYEGSKQRGIHFADHGVLLIDTFDNPAFSIAIEKVKLSFRSSYSLLDKIAGFLNHYLALQIEPDKVTIRNVWHEKKALRAKFEKLPNWHLRGLYWLSRDIADDHDKRSETALEPEARKLKELRHTLEHRCLVLRERDSDKKMDIVDTAQLSDFELKALKLLKLVRAALIHLALAVLREERQRSKNSGGLVTPMSLPTYRHIG